MTIRQPIPPPDPREAKLPRWAQDHLATMRRQVEAARRAEDAARLATSPDESDTLLDRYAESDIPIGLGVGISVHFLFGEVGDRRAPAIQARLHRPVGRHGPLPVYLELIGISGGITVSPQSGNVIRVRDERF